MAVTANQITLRSDGIRGSGPAAASTTLYEGTMAFQNGTGYVDDDTNTGSNKFAGIVIDKVDNSSGSAGDLNAELWQDGEFELTGSGFTQGTVGSDIYASDNYTITTAAASNSYVGRCVGFVSTTKLRVKINVNTEPENVTAVDLDDDEDALFGTGDDAGFQFSTADASNHAFVLFVDDTSQQLHITDKLARNTDWSLAPGTHPAVFIHSNTTPITDYLRIGDHDGTEADIDVVGGTSLSLMLAGTQYASLRVTGLAVGTYVEAATAGTDQLTLKSTGTAPAGTGANVGHLFADFETDDDELFWLSGTVGTSTQLTT